jgi:uncharacterized protein (TIGR03083 family)
MPATADLETIEREGRRIIGYGRRDPGRVVPQYPTWTLRDLIVHVAGVHGRTGVICETLSREQVPTTEPATGQDPFAWAEAQLERMLDGLHSADPEAEVWTFVDDPRLGFWSRRMIIETGVHRWDAQAALETPEPLLPLVAAHGLDEFPELYLPRLGQLPTVELKATDLGRSWHYGYGEPVAAIEGTASDLYLRLMQRPGAPLPPGWEAAVDALGSPDRR